MAEKGGSMVKVGFIGYGSMGSMLVNSLISARALTPDEIIISTRTKSKLDSLVNQHSNIAIANDNTEVAKCAKYIFICVKALEMRDIILEIKNTLDPGKVIVSTAGAVKIKHLEELSGARVVKFIPTITSEVFSGVSLVSFGRDIEKKDVGYIEALLGKISNVKIVSEKDIGFATELTSCMPGFIASIFKELSSSANLKESSLTNQEIDELIISTLYGTAKLFFEKGWSFDEALDRVATKGGITEEGAKVLGAHLPEVFEKMLTVTLNKRRMVNEKVDILFGNF